MEEKNIKLFESWVLDSEGYWTTPIEFPNDGGVWHWSEENINWMRWPITGSIELYNQ
jgi:hypothetical protein